MKVSMHKSISHAILVESSDLQGLCQYLLQKYKRVEIAARCSDGSKRETEDISDILSYGNQDYHKIVMLAVTGINDQDDKAEIAIFTNRRFTSAEFDVVSRDDEKPVLVSTEILSRLKDMRPTYHLLVDVQSERTVATVCATLATMIGIVFLAGLWGASVSVDLELVSRNLFWFSLLAVSCVAFLRLGDSVVTYLFPLVFFDIGRQAQKMKRIEWFRNVLFIVIALGILIGLIANAISKQIL